MTAIGQIRIAMWSGPRNISTALMRAWEARGDTAVWDEPFYAHYLDATRREHPGRSEIIAAYETDWQKVVDRLVGPAPGASRIFYQKHMAHHLLPGMVGPWLLRLKNAFLIRDPEEMIVSLARVTRHPMVEDTGLPQQVELFQYLRDAMDAPPPVIDARDVLTSPGPMLRKLCAALGVAYTDRMLSWDPGPRPSDGIWGRYWYDSVRASTGFRPYRPAREALPARLREVFEECIPHYERLHRHRILPDDASDV